MKSDDFDAYFRAIHSVDPFPWQRRLARLLCETNTWPRVIDLPTGAGKTACIDIALFHLLVSAARGQASQAARRIAFVVDRRIIVDEAADRARRISTTIETATGGVLHAAAALVRSLSGQSTIDVRTLRGGVPRERSLVRDPTAVGVVLSTVDQLGSRLLFRGYGVSDFAKPMHAGMFGFDTLLLLDEAHIAEPFRQTLVGIEREQARAAVDFGPRPLRWSQLSATPTAVADFSIDAEDRKHSVLQRRLSAKKPLSLLRVQKREELPKLLTDLVVDELSQPSLDPNEAPRIGIVVNRVSSARDIHAALAKRFKEAELHLLIGRTRPIDRDRLMVGLSPLLRSSTASRPGNQPIIIVATQTIEVGADFDFHSMFVEAASYPAIKQRVGRLNRLGLRKSARGAIVLVATGAEDDPLYGSTIARTWEVLEASARDGVADLGIESAPAAVPEAVPASPPTPLLTPAIVGLLAQTSPRPEWEPDVAELLHGFENQAADLSIVWREGISRHADAGREENVDETLARILLESVPPLSMEAMSLPLSSFRGWLRALTTKKAAKVVDAGDVEGDVLPDEDEDSDRKVVVVDDGGVRAIFPRDLRPGMTIVVPAGWGGVDVYGFAPESTARVADLSLVARRESGRSTIVVVVPSIVRSWFKADSTEASTFLKDLASRFRELEADDAGASESRDAFFEWFDEAFPLLRPDIVDVLNELRSQPSAVDIVPLDDGLRALAIRARRPKSEDLVDDSVGLQRTVDVELSEHCIGVAEFAEQFAKNVGFSNDVVADLRLSGRLHDLGKADPRFQAMLGADGTRLLAKGGGFDGRVTLGARHECYSVALVDRHPELLSSASDSELVRYLVGSHHGRGRGLQPIVDDVGAAFEVDMEGRTLSFKGRPNLEAIGSGWGELFGRLQQRYGPWGLAYLETVLRLADHRRSEREIEEAYR